MPEVQRSFCRITPAWAGKRPQTTHRVKPRGDHPRVGGEKLKQSVSDRDKQGSPPRGRGKDTEQRATAHAWGITPAWAGKSSGIKPAVPIAQDHPRVGGEKDDGHPAGRRPEGSPPRGRGKAFVRVGLLLCIGITPAWAGKSQGRRAGERKAQDHPRVGGEKATRASATWAPAGSPPRGRGKGMKGRAAAGQTGITPAWAGKRRPAGLRAGRPRDHPRVGGEKQKGIAIIPRMLGSPPRGRGKGCLSRLFPRRIGITPAWAGKSWTTRIELEAREDHPRVGGEK